ncbi:MAG: ATP-binding protein [Ezakiella sp.]|nr:cell wall metabolism sensor histidine kinase WalK [Ezakiella sp.]MDD7761087.1 ATP-binding protein [Bacillota bacterium]MDY3947412.1 ATP-binding protein [Ezakiella sp.]
MNSIKWRFVVVYFLLVLAVLLIVATSVTGRLETSLIEDKMDSMKSQIESMLTTRPGFKEDVIDYDSTLIDASLGAARFQNDEDVYIIGREELVTVIAARINTLEDVRGMSAYNIERLNPNMIRSGYLGESSENIIENENGREAHLVMPIMGDNGVVKGLVYAILNLDNISNTLTKAKRIMLDSGLVALLITIVLSYMIASGITSPIIKATEIAKKMSEGDFDQRIKVKSHDEIGRFGEMFNMLAVELKNYIRRSEIERAKLDTIFNQMAEGVVAIDSNRKIIHINERARELFDIPLDIDTRSISTKLSEMGLSDLNFANPFSLEGEDDIKLKDKNYRFIYAPFEDKSLNVGGVIVVYQDMTKERKLEEMRREFVANVSHELKTPITSIKSYAETLMKYEVDNETKNNFLEVIDHESDRMSHIVSDLLTLSTLDYSEEKKKLTKVNISEVASSAAQRMRMPIKDKKHALYLSIEKDLYSMADEEDLLQVVINLISNAVKYTPENGIIHLNVYTDGRKNYISVEDNGVGIKAKDQPRIFERFYRVEKSRSRALGGTGLGLAIAKEMIEAMNGTISLESEYQKGSTFTIAFDKELHNEDS